MITKNKKSRILKITFLLFSFFFLFSSVYAADSNTIPDTEPCWVKGSITSSDFTVDTLTVGAYLGSTLLKSSSVDVNGNFSLNSVGSNTGDTISLKVYGATFETFTFEGFCKTSGDPWVVIDEFEVNKVSNGTSCSSNLICTSGNCSGGVCAAVTTGGGSSGGSTGGTTSTVTPETVVVNYSSSTDLITSNDVREILEESDLTPDEIEEYMSAYQEGALSFERNLEVVKTTSSTTGLETYSSTFTIVIKNNSNKQIKDIRIVETIPKEIAEDASLITSPYEFRVLVSDPVIEFIIPSLDVGQETTIPYSVNNNVTEDQLIEMNGVIYKADFSEVETNLPIDTTNDENEPIETVYPYNNNPLPGPEKTSNLTFLWIILILVGIFIIVYFVHNSKKSKRVKK